MKDKELIKREIERIDQILDDFNKTHNNTIDNGIVSAKKNICKQIKSFIDSLPEEPASEDLDFIVISLEETIGTSPRSRDVIKEHLQRAAEWQKQQMLDKAVSVLKANNIFGVHPKIMDKIIEDFKKAMEE